MATAVRDRERLARADANRRERRAVSFSTTTTPDAPRSSTATGLAAAYTQDPAPTCLPSSSRETSVEPAERGFGERVAAVKLA